MAERKSAATGRELSWFDLAWLGVAIALLIPLMFHLAQIVIDFARSLRG